MQDFDDDVRFGDDLLQEKPKGKSRALCIPFILIGGLVTTIATLIGIFVLSLYFGTIILSYIVNFVIPVGALGAGILAGSGYAIAARVLQYKPSGKFIFFICVLQFGMFFVGRYMEFVGRYMEYVPVTILVKEPTAFMKYYRFQIEESEWTSDDSKEPYKMGKWGWGLELLTALAFSLTSMIWIAVLSAVAYCSRCRLFMKRELDFAFPARAPAEKIKKKDTEALEAFQERDATIFAQAMVQVVKIVEFLRTDQAKNPDEAVRFLTELRDGVDTDPKSMKGVPNQIKVHYSRCRDCDNYQLIVKLEATAADNKNAMQGGELVRYLDGKFVTLAVDTTPPEESTETAKEEQV